MVYIPGTVTEVAGIVTVPSVNALVPTVPEVVRIIELPVPDTSPFVPTAPETLVKEAAEVMSVPFGSLIVKARVVTSATPDAPAFVILTSATMAVP
jgi:hypothetical protein